MQTESKSSTKIQRGMFRWSQTNHIMNFDLDPNVVGYWLSSLPSEEVADKK